MDNKALSKLPEPYYQTDDGMQTIYCGDSLELLPLIEPGSVDLVLTDPPYGINWKPRINHKEQLWIDDKQFDPLPFLAVGTEHLFWGANYFCRLLPHSADWLVWVKRPINYDFSNDKRSYSTVELAWSNYGCGSRFKAHVWDGGMRAGEKTNREFLHPSQKPTELIIWCLSFSKTTGAVLDPFLGSGTTLVACQRLGRRGIGIEIEEKYCEIAKKRLSQYMLPGINGA